MAHSKGPWRIADWSKDRKPEIVDVYEDTVATVGTGYLSTVEADAELIAAAPDLLEAAEYALAYIHEAWAREEKLPERDKTVEAKLRSAVERTKQ